MLKYKKNLFQKTNKFYDRFKQVSKKTLFNIIEVIFQAIDLDYDSPLIKSLTIKKRDEGDDDDILRLFRNLHLSRSDVYEIKLLF